MVIFGLKSIYLLLLMMIDEVTAVVAYFRDVSESVKLSKDLNSYEEKFNNLEGIINEGIISTNLKGVITSVNQNLLEISGLAEEDFIGKKITKMPLLEPMFVPRFESIIESITSGRQLPVFEFRWIDRNDSVRWFEVETSPRIKNNRKGGIHVIFSDITEQKTIVQDLLKSKQAYKVIIENAHEAIFILQEDKVKFCNSRLLEMVNYSMDELIKTPIQEYIHPRDQKSASEKIKKAFKEKSTKPISFRIIDNNGNIRWIEIKSILIDWDNQPALLAFATDITDSKRESEKEKKELESLKFLSEKALEFVELKSDYNIYQFIVEKIKEVIGDSIILVFSYDPYTNITKTEFIECPEDARENLLTIINNSPDRLNHKLNHELIKNLSFGKVIKYNDGLFEKGYNIFQKNTFELIQQKLNVGGIYLIGLTWENFVYGNIMIFNAEGKKIENHEAIETIVKLGSFALQRKNAEEALRNSEEKYRRIFESYQDVYYRADIDGSIIRCQPIHY